MAKSQIQMPGLHLTLKNKVFAHPTRSSKKQTTSEKRTALMSHINEKNSTIWHHSVQFIPRHNCKKVDYSFSVEIRGE
jgi:hypothetical protein